MPELVGSRRRQMCSDHLVVSEISITEVNPVNGLVAFASCVVNGQFYIGSIGIHQRINGLGYRLVYPTKKVKGRQNSLCHPITKEVGIAIEEAISKQYKELINRKSEHNHVRHCEVDSSHTKPAYF